MLSAKTLGMSNDAELTHPYRPQPDIATGGLLVDPEISLSTLGLNLTVEFFYNSLSTANGPYGLKRSSSLNGYVVSDPQSPTVVRGNEKLTGYGFSSSSGGTSFFNDLSSTPQGTSLSFDGTTYQESFSDGSQLTYQQPPGTTGITFYAPS